MVSATTSSISIAIRCIPSSVAGRLGILSKGHGQKTVLKASGALFAGGAFSRLVSGEARKTGRKLSVPREPVAPSQVSRGSAGGRKELQPSASAGHSPFFNGIADSGSDQVSLKNLDQMSLDKNAHTATVGAGVTYGKLSRISIKTASLYQPGVAAAYFGLRRLRNRDSRLRQTKMAISQRQFPHWKS